MIKHIYVNNYALIRNLNLDLASGFTTITGETGAGKSILLGALGLVLGNRAEPKALANDDQKCIVEVVFGIRDLGLKSFFDMNELDFDEECILRREILPSGKSRAFVNDTPVKLDILKTLGERLVDIHSQHDSILMMNPAFQLEMLDAIAQNKKEREDYQIVYSNYLALKKERDLLAEQLKVQRDTDYMEFLVEELERASLIENEEVQIEEELKVLRHAEEIKLGLSQGASELNDEFGILNKLHTLIKAIQNIDRYLPEAKLLAERLNSVEIELKDISAEIDAIDEDVNLDESRLNNLEERNNALLHLMQKHQVRTTGELIEKFNHLSDQLYLIKRGAEALKEKDAEIAHLLQKLRNVGAILHKSRVETADNLGKKAGEFLERLQLQHAKLSIELNMIEKPTASGFDEVVFLFTANLGSKAQAINKVASGGELSRVMLSLKAILAETKSLPAIIFDEIDSGISGETAKRAASILSEMGSKMQVIAITHLPQIAASGKTQLQVSKKVEKGSTTTCIETLDKSARVEEIARLLSGEAVSEAARKTAEELLA